MVNIFVLKLQEGKYYVGSCNNIDQDVNSYLNGKFGPKWIKIYRPIRVIEVISPCDIFDVDKHTKRYMGLYGVNNVRGGAYSSVKLSKSDRNHIDKEIFTALGMCIHCGSENHISSVCYHKSYKWQFKSFLVSIKINLNTLKDNIKDCFNSYTQYQISRQYDTLNINEERRLIIDSPHRTTTHRTTNQYMEEDINMFPISLHTLSFSNSFSPSVTPPPSPLGLQRQTRYISHSLSSSPEPLLLTPPPLQRQIQYPLSSSPEPLLTPPIKTHYPISPIIDSFPVSSPLNSNEFLFNPG